MVDTIPPRISSTDLKIDPYGPAEMADRAQTVGIAKARLDTLTLLTLGVLAGAFIALGADPASRRDRVLPWPDPGRHRRG